MVDRAPGSNRRWQFNGKILLFAALFLPLLIYLGLWQLDRADEKQQQMDQWQTESLNLSWPEHLERGLSAGQPVTLAGRYSKKTWLLDNRTRDGQPGYEVLTQFQPEDGQGVVINRGWVRAPNRRENLPQVSSPDKRVLISGRLAEYPEPPVLNGGEELAAGWPRRVQSLTRTDASASGEQLAPLIVRLKGPEQPGAYRADWAPDRMGPQTHYGYAAQWFSLAVALVILTLAASYRKAGANNDNDNG